jgi:hypothetical protein
MKDIMKNDKLTLVERKDEWMKEIIIVEKVKTKIKNKL